MAGFADICEKSFIIITYSHLKTLTPPEELKQMRARFISIREVCGRVREEYPEMTNKEALEWIFGKAYEKAHLVKHLFAGHSISIPPEDIKKIVTNDDKWLDSYGFIRSELKQVLSMDLSVPLFNICYQDNVYAEIVQNRKPEDAEIPFDDIAGNSKLPANEEIDFEPDTKGSTESDMIAALTFGLAEKIAACCKKNGGINVSEVVRYAQRNLAKRGGEFTVSDRTLRGIVARSIKKYTPDSENEANQNEKPH
ncbi:TPA: hypothetical protein N3A45_003472 [Salmonella enterica subsp. salamae serovar [1],40:z35:e,n,x,z15]|nr:hypothetical protein [Salmonella enterica]HCM2000331.1 hypothetical protein [Salmonella enterica subsp. salamae serovar [1],40:z35:e,n,x,z15]